MATRRRVVPRMKTTSFTNSSLFLLANAGLPLWTSLRHDTNIAPLMPTVEKGIGWRSHHILLSSKPTLGLVPQAAARYQQGHPM
ncbi:hypothetical protein BDR03DRAFT_965724 [Suillus americanus]|nr:hypothetical protein BDR03DRAFT_965724 [Suillus americanus]